MVRDSYGLNKVLPIELTQSLYSFEVLQEPFSEQSILELQEKFLTNGFHYIKVPNQRFGRILIERFLATMHTHHDKACITLDINPLGDQVANIYHVLTNMGYLDPFDLHDMRDFFIEHFYFDFMWIEATKKLLVSSWFCEFEKLLLDFHMEKHIPMIVVLYEHE